MYWHVVLQQRIFNPSRVLGKVVRFLHIYSFLYQKFFFTYKKQFLNKRHWRFWLFFFTPHMPVNLTFFLKDLALVKLSDIFFYYLKYSSLKPDFSKWGIAEIVSLKTVEVAVCGIKYVNLKVYTIKILGICFLCNNNLNMKKMS